MAGRINDKMSIKEAMIIMAARNFGAMACMEEMLQCDSQAMADIMFLDSLGIYGPKLYMLWNDCCKRDMTQFQRTLEFFRSGKISRESIHENLDRVRAVPFI